MSIQGVLKGLKIFEMEYVKKVNVNEKVLRMLCITHWEFETDKDICMVIGKKYTETLYMHNT